MDVATIDAHGKDPINKPPWDILQDPTRLIRRLVNLWTCRCYRQHQAGTDGHRELIFKCFAAETRHHTTRSLAAVQGQWERPLGMNVVNLEIVEVRKQKRRGGGSLVPVENGSLVPVENRIACARLIRTVEKRRQDSCETSDEPSEISLSYPMSPCLPLKVCMSSVPCPLNPISPCPYVPMSNPKGVYVFCTMSPKPHIPMSLCSHV